MAVPSNRTDEQPELRDETPPAPRSVHPPKPISDRLIILLIGGLALAGIACMLVTVLVLLLAQD